MALYAIGQRVWCKSQKSLGIITEARYTPKAEYVIQLVTGMQKYDAAGKRYHIPVDPPRDYMTSSKDLRAADWSCDGCDRWLAGSPYATAPDGEYPSGLQFCFLCAAPQVLDPHGLGWNYR
jgi:hypothetical protein